jgi:TonB family protein
MLCWWNPLAWKAWREFVKERERAADDLVLHAGVCASDYASRLLEVARRMSGSRLTATAAVTMARRSQLEGRLLAILDAHANRRAATRTSTIAAAVLALATVIPLAAVRAQSNWPADDALPPDIETFVRTAIEQRNAAALENAARAAVDLRKYETAQKLMQAAADVEMQTAGPQSTEYGLDLLRLARLAEKQQDRAKAVDLYSRAAYLLGNKPQAAPALFYLGADAISKKDYAGAIADFERARAADPAQTGLALMWIAVARQQEGRGDEAAGLYRDALAHQTPNSREAVTTMTLFEDLLRSNGNTDAAAEIASRIDAANKALEAQATALPARDGAYNVRTPGIRKPKLLDKTDPNYTDEARAAKLQGREVLNVVIGPDGLVHDAHVVSGIGLGLDENGIDAVSQWRFQPATKDGEPVPVTATIEINFRLL